MAFPTGWNRKCAVTIDADEVAGALTDFPVMLTEDCLPSEMFDADGSYPAQNGGGDLRFSSDEAGTTQLPCEVVSFVTDNDPANGTAQIHVQVSSVSSSVDTTIYVWYNTAGTESQPAADSTYGSENVWDSNYVGVWHLEEDPGGSAPQMLDSTSNGHHGTSHGSMTSGDSVAGVAGNGLDHDGSDDYIQVAETTALDITDEVSVEICLNPDASGSFITPVVKSRSGQKQYAIDLNSGVPRWGENGGVVKGTTTLSNGTWYYVAGTYNDNGAFSGLKLYVNGSAESTSNVGSFSGLTSTNGDFYIGQAGYGGERFNGQIDEVRVSAAERSAAWVAATHSTLLTPDTFASAGTPESPPVANTGAALLMQMIGQ